MIKTKSCQPMGEYHETGIDVRKQNVDFKLVQVSPCYIKWKNGKVEKVNKQKLNKLQKEFTWETDF